MFPRGAHKLKMVQDSKLSNLSLSLTESEKKPGRIWKASYLRELQSSVFSPSSYLTYRPQGAIDRFGKIKMAYASRLRFHKPGWPESVWVSFPWSSQFTTNVSAVFFCGVVFHFARYVFSGEKLWPLIRPDIQSEKDGLYPIQTLVQPVSLRFKYHFEGTRQTNRVDKVRW
jgi:hypothetical protein